MKNKTKIVELFAIIFFKFQKLVEMNFFFL